MSTILTGEIALGYLTRVYKDPTLPNLEGLLLDASLIWIPTGLTTVKFNARTTADESTLAGVSGVLSRNVSLQVDHAFRRWLIGTARFGYGLDDYVGSIREDHRYVAAAGITYKLTRAWQIKGELRQEVQRARQRLHGEHRAGRLALAALTSRVVMAGPVQACPGHSRL